MKEDIKEQDQRIGQALADIQKKYLVMSGKGGVGKTTVAVNLAAALAERAGSVGLLDVDLHGPNTLKMLGLEGMPITAAANRFNPLQYNANLKVMSIAGLLQSSDTAVIWRGPMKIGVIRQFIGDAAWGRLDYLVIDAPPGTGDEPLTVAQTVTGAEAIIVTTPQAISVLDVSKSITFCRQVSMPIAGLVENMSAMNCPHCGKPIQLFGSGHGKQIAEETGIPFLGSLPLDPKIAASGDAGGPYILTNTHSEATTAFNRIVDALLEISE